MLEAQGFVDVRLTASYSSYGTPDAVAAIAQWVREYILSPISVEIILENGWATQAEIDQAKADFSTWAQMPGAFHMRAWVEAVARKP